MFWVRNKKIIFLLRTLNLKAWYDDGHFAQENLHLPDIGFINSHTKADSSNNYWKYSSHPVGLICLP